MTDPVEGIAATWAPVRETGFTIHGDRVELFKAIALAQAGFTEILKTRENPFFKSKYADLSDVLAACVPSLNANGLALIQPPCRPSSDSDWTLYTLLTHSSGAYIEMIATIPPVADWQKFGSAIAYCRRYSVGSLLGVAPEVDDDGNHASEPDQRRGNARPPQPPAPKPQPAKIHEPVELAAKGSPFRVEDKQVVEQPLSHTETVQRAQDVIAAAEASVGVSRPSVDDTIMPGQVQEMKALLNGKMFKDPETGEVQRFTRPIADMLARSVCGCTYPEVKSFSQAKKLLDALREMPDKVASAT